MTGWVESQWQLICSLGSSLLVSYPNWGNLDGKKGQTRSLNWLVQKQRTAASDVGSRRCDGGDRAQEARVVAKHTKLEQAATKTTGRTNGFPSASFFSNCCRSSFLSPCCNLALPPCHLSTAARFTSSFVWQMAAWFQLECSEVHVSIK